MQQAALLYDLDSEYRLLQATDRGRKTVLVWGYRIGATASHPHRAVVQRLQALEQAALALVPAAGDPYQPEAVRVQSWDSGETGATAAWPDELTGQLKGEQARRAMQLAGSGPSRLCRLQGREQRVLAAARGVNPNAPRVIAGFMPDDEDAGQSPPRRRPAWVVRAERPGGSSTELWVDAATFAAFRPEEHGH